MKTPVLFRKRIIPDECIRLKDDKILYFSPDKHILVTKWHALKPRKDLHHGFSCYFYDKGFKISKFYRENGDLLYWYCDIIETEYPVSLQGISAPGEECMVSTDLLADVIIYPDGFVKVVDLEELTAAFDAGSLSLELLKTALNRLSNLLRLIYSGEFAEYQHYLEQYETDK
ncbi:MAG: DUF402 domain-containing protein [Lachnospiraceae bacterium]|nr:DUF402 domain-containing protein [Lachnospiraceae bacterium]